MTDKSDIKAPKTQMPTVNIDAIAEFGRISDHITGLLRSLDQEMAGLRTALKGNFLNINRVAMDAVKGWKAAVEGTFNDPVAKQALRDGGVLPHKSTPWHLFDPDKPGEFGDAALSHYSNEWEQACAVFQIDLEEYKIGKDAKEAFVEGIKCHTAKLYRAAILTVLPAAESEFRRTFEISPGKKAAGLEELRKAVLEAPARVILGHVAPFDLFEMLDVASRQVTR